MFVFLLNNEYEMTLICGRLQEGKQITFRSNLQNPFENLLFTAMLQILMFEHRSD